MSQKEPAQLAYEAFHARANVAAYWSAPSWNDAGPVARNNWRAAFDAGVEGLPEGANVNDLPLAVLEPESDPHPIAAPTEELPS